MHSSFSSEWRAWKAVLDLRKGTVLFFGAVLVVLISLFLVMVSEYRLFQHQAAQVTTQVELIAELDSALPEEQRAEIRTSLEELEGVRGVEYWSAERSAQYIDQRILDGYESFLKKNQLQIPVNPLFRIQLTDLARKDQLQELIADRYLGQLTVSDSDLTRESQSFAGQFVTALMQSAGLFQVVVVLCLLLVLAVGGYFQAIILSERSKGFHLTQMLHLAPAYTFWPALFMSVLLALVFNVLGLLLAALFLGDFLWLLSGLLFGAFVLMHVVLVWFGRYVAKLKL